MLRKLIIFTRCALSLLIDCLYAANGFARAEGIVVVYLQKKESANRVYAAVVHSKSSSDGYKEEGTCATVVYIVIFIATRVESRKYYQ